jgi:DNA-binding GntR family transcriptional regulator
MQTSAVEMLALQRASELEAPLAEVENHLAELAQALRERDAARIEAASAALHRTLARAVERFGRAARQAPIPGPLRQRLMSAGAQVAAQREVLARATASLDRAIDVLLPAPAPGVYSAAGCAERMASSGEMLG